MRSFLLIGIFLCALPVVGQSLKQIDSLINAGEYQQADAAITSIRSTATGELLSRLSNREAEVRIAQGKLDEAQKVLEDLVESTKSNPFLQAETKTINQVQSIPSGRNQNEPGLSIS